MRSQVVFGVLSILSMAVLLAVCAQEYRYHRTRRDLAGDRQALLHSPSAFHVATLLQLKPGRDLLASVRDFVGASERAGATVVYAGKIAVNAMQSAQVPAAEWDAFVLAQYPSRADYAEAETDRGYRASRASFANSYALGMQRSPWLNAAIPVGLLGLRAADVVTRRPARYPFTPAPVGSAGDGTERRARVVEGLLAHREFGKNAVVVLNFIKEGTAEQREADSGYGFEMLKMMAEVGAGPMHMGQAVTLEGGADFDTLAIVFYPGVEFFAEMVQSEFYTGIVAGKQLGDTLASPSVPLLPRL